MGIARCESHSGGPKVFASGRVPRRRGLLKPTVSQVHVRIDACALERASHGASHTAVGRKVLPAGAYRGAQACSRPRCRNSMCGSTHVSLDGHRAVRITQRWDASPQEADALSERRGARKTTQCAICPPQEAGNAAPGPTTPPFRGVLRGRGDRSKSLAFLAQDAEYSTTPF